MITVQYELQESTVWIVKIFSKILNNFTPGRISFFKVSFLQAILSFQKLFTSVDIRPEAKFFRIFSNFFDDPTLRFFMLPSVSKDNKNFLDSVFIFSGTVKRSEGFFHSEFYTPSSQRISPTIINFLFEDLKFRPSVVVLEFVPRLAFGLSKM